MTFNHCTVAQFRAYLRFKYRTASRLEAVQIGAWIFNNLTLAQIRALFNATTAQAQNIQARCQTKAQQLAAMQAAAGE